MPPDITILITAYHEASTIGRALAAIQAQIDLAASQVLVICPDEETAQAAQAVPGVAVLRDSGRGKAAALNLGLAHAQGRVIVMTDGDVTVRPGALAALLAPLEDPQVGAVSGHPVSISPRDTMLGYWSHLLTEAGAHAERIRRDARGQFLVCSGYLYAIRAGLVTAIPEEALAEDGVVSQIIGEQGWRIRYAPGALVNVRYPATYADWLKQKVRSTGGYAQPLMARSSVKMRTFQNEVGAGLGRSLAYARSPRELAWTLGLLVARLHLWLVILWAVRVRHRPLAALWQRVESTKGG